MNRTPPSDVQRKLRHEVGFGCPVPGCGSPYLTWHHFDPPWRVRQHHDPSGMLALCPSHHFQADRGTWTKQQLRSFKREAVLSRQVVKGKFEWMRQSLLGVAGGNGVYNVPVLFYCSRQPIIWFSRDANQYLQVNLRRPRTSSDADLVMLDNNWLISSDVADIECPPRGNLLAVTYPNGDAVRIEFHELASGQQACERYPGIFQALSDLTYPLVAVEFQIGIPSLDIDIGPSRIQLPGDTVAQNCFMRDCDIGYAVGPVVHMGSVAVSLWR